MIRRYSKASAGTFALNKTTKIHRWYSYLEGYSSCLIDDLIHEIGIDRIKTIYDLFCGAGTQPHWLHQVMELLHICTQILIQSKAR